MINIKMGLTKKVSYKDLSIISGNIAKLCEDNINFLNILSLLDELPLKQVYKDGIRVVEDAIKRGRTLEEGFNEEEDIFPKFFISMVGIGEKTGKITYVFKGLEVYYKKINYIKNTIITYLTYPAILLAALIILAFFVFIFFIPNMADTFSSMGNDMTNIYKIVIKANEAIRENIITTILLIILWGMALPYFIIKKYFSERLKNILYKIPIYNLINEYIAIVLMSVVVNSGINISTGLEYCCEGEFSKNISGKMKMINQDIIQGKTLEEAMRKTGIFSKYTLAHIKLGEESGSLDNRMKLLEEELFEKITMTINKSLQYVQPVLIIFMAIAIVSFILIFIMPIFDIAI